MVLGRVRPGSSRFCHDRAGQRKPGRLESRGQGPRELELIAFGPHPSPRLRDQGDQCFGLAFHCLVGHSLRSHLTQRTVAGGSTSTKSVGLSMIRY